MISSYLEPVYDEIERVVGHYGGGVSAKDVAERMLYRYEVDIRRDMNDLWRAGRLVFVGGNGVQRRYRLPNALERLMLASGWRGRMRPAIATRISTRTRDTRYPVTKSITRYHRLEWYWEDWSKHE